MKLNILLFMVITGFLCACNDETVSRSRYRCPGNLWIEVTFSGGKRVEIDSEGQKVVLKRIESSSGAKYESDEGHVFWAMGKDAEFSEKPGGAPISCQRR